MVFEQLRAVLASQFDVEEDTITLDTNIQDDLCSDSLDLVDLIMTLEDEFDIEIPDEAVENIRTVGQAVDFIEANT